MRLKRDSRVFVDPTYASLARDIRTALRPRIRGERERTGGLQIDLMVGEKKAISRGIFGYNGPCGCLGGHCAVQKSIIYIYSIYILLPPLPVCQTDPKWSYSSLAPAFRCASPADCRLASPTRWAPWILVRSRRSYAPLGRPAALGLR